MQVATFMDYSLRYATDTEMQMNAIERIKEYSGLANEDYKGRSSHISSFNEFVSPAIQVDYGAERYLICNIIILIVLWKAIIESILKHSQFLLHEYIN